MKSKTKEKGRSKKENSNKKQR